MSSQKVRIGLIGAGQMGRGHIGCLSTIDGLQLVAVADPHGPSIEEARKLVSGDVAEYEDYRELLARADVEAVLIATPNHTHADITAAALEAGKHVLCEKPMATTVADCDRMIAARDASAKVLQIGLELRSDPALRKMKELVQSGVIGAPYSLWIKEFRGPFLEKVGRWITTTAFSGGTLVEKDCHHYDLFNWLTDSPVMSTAAFGGQDVEVEHGDALDNAWTIQEHQSGARSTLGLCMFCDRGAPVLEVGVIGSEGKVQYDYGQPIRLHLRHENEVRTYDESLPKEIAKLSHNGAVYYEHLCWLDAIRHGGEVRVTGEIGRESVIVPLACQQAIAERRVVDVDKEFRQSAG